MASQKYTYKVSPRLKFKKRQATNKMQLPSGARPSTTNNSAASYSTRKLMTITLAQSSGVKPAFWGLRPDRHGKNHSTKVDL